MKKYCCKPFKRLTIEFDGNVSFCCPSYNNYYFIGNIFENSFEELWYGEKATEFRKSIIDGSYKYCNLNICGEYKDDDSFYEDEKTEEELIHPEYPEVVNLSYVKSCNVRCKTCRDKLIVEKKEDTNFLDKCADKIIDICSHAVKVYLNGNGELFASPHLKKIVKEIIAINPKVRFFIHTNGLLCNELNFKEWGLDGKIDSIIISIHAATKETYESIVRGGNWERLISNLEYMKKLNIDLFFAFVLHSLNYKEMPAFVKMAKKFNAKPVFWRFRNWNNDTQMCNNIDTYSCWESKHPEYENFLKVLNKLKRMRNYEYILQEQFLRDLQNKSKNPWWVLFKK